MMTINQIIRQGTPIKGVWLNRQGDNKGTKIGSMLKLFGKLYYFTVRTDEHYYIKGQGFAIDAGILKALQTTELNYHRMVQSNPNVKIYILLLYKGKTVNKLLTANVEDFEEIIQYVKGDSETVETYGAQRVLPELMFNLWKEEKRDS